MQLLKYFALFPGLATGQIGMQKSRDCASLAWCWVDNSAPMWRTSASAKYPPELLPTTPTGTFDDHFSLTKRMTADKSSIVFPVACGATPPFRNEQVTTAMEQEDTKDCDTAWWDSQSPCVKAPPWTKRHAATVGVSFVGNQTRQSILYPSEDCTDCGCGWLSMLYLRECAVLYSLWQHEKVNKSEIKMNPDMEINLKPGNLKREQI